jgi:sigma-B regulation protein RsbU (phosphoserine phosphatase)
VQSNRNGSAVRHRDFYRKLSGIMGGIDRAQGLESMLTQILESVTREFSEDLGIQSGRLYRDETDEFVIVRSFGSKGKGLIGQSVPRDYPILRDLRENEVLYCAPDDDRLDPELEERLGVRHFAAFYVGLERQYLAAFGFDDSGEAQEIVLTLSAVRYAIQHRLRELSLAGQLREARAIQISSLPRRSPDFAGFELAGISEPAEEVGGDILDFLPIDENLLGIALGDASCEWASNAI